jgi:hypothetical protein
MDANGRIEPFRNLQTGDWHREFFATLPLLYEPCGISPETIPPPKNDSEIPPRRNSFLARYEPSRLSIGCGYAFAFLLRRR